MKLPQCVFLGPNSELRCLRQQRRHQDQAFSKALTCAKHRYCQHRHQNGANKSSCASLACTPRVHSKSSGTSFQRRVVIRVRAPLSFKARASCKSTGGRRTDSAQSLGKAVKLKESLGNKLEALRMAAEGPGRSGDDDLQPSSSSWRSGWGAGTERAGWPGACQLFTFNKLARIRKLRLGS